jgi:hypothetical protein
LTAQQVSDELRVTLGFDMKRAVLGNLETGLRRSVGIAEIFALAYVLEVPAVLLTVPVDEQRFEVLPGMAAHPWHAARWLTGAGVPWMFSGVEGMQFEAELVPAYRNQVNVLSLYRQHDDGVAQWLRVVRMVESSEAGDGLRLDGEPAPVRLREIEDGLALLRWSIRDKGSVPPPLPPQLEHLDDQREGGTTTDA